MDSLQPDGSIHPVKILMTLKESLNLQGDALPGATTEPQFSEAELNEQLETLKAFLGELPCSEEVTKLALKKCKLDLQEALVMLTTDQVADLEEEVRTEQEADDDLQLMTNQRTGVVGAGAQEEGKGADE